MSQAKESSHSNVLLKTVSINTYEKLFSLDVLELLAIHHISKLDDIVLENFKSQLTRDENGCYETSLIWKERQCKHETKREIKVFIG